MEFYKVFCVAAARNYLIEKGYSILQILQENGKDKLELGDYLLLSKQEKQKKFVPFSGNK